MFLELLRTAHGAHLLRVKGIIALADDPARPLVIHGVQHIFHPPARLDAWPDADHTTRIVFILEDMEPSFVKGMWDAFHRPRRRHAGRRGADAKSAENFAWRPVGLSRF